MDIPQLMPKGSKVKTNYSDTIFTVKKVSKECTCPHPINTLAGKPERHSTPHYHIVVTYPDGATGYLNGYFFNVLYEIINCWNTKDKLVLLNDDGTERSLQPAQKGTPGRKPGTAARTATLKIRCRPDLLEVIKELQTNGWASHGLSASDLIHLAIKSWARRDMPDSDKSFGVKVDNLDKEVKTLLQRM